MIILRNKQFSRFDLTPEEQEVWEKSIKRDGKRPSIKKLFQQARKYKKGELSYKELDNLGIEYLRPETMHPERINVGREELWGNGASARRGAHDDVLRSRIAKKKIGKNLTIGAAVLGGTAVLGTGAYLTHKHSKKKNTSN